MAYNLQSLVESGESYKLPLKFVGFAKLARPPSKLNSTASSENSPLRRSSKMTLGNSAGVRLGEVKRSGAGDRNIGYMRAGGGLVIHEEACETEGGTGGGLGLGDDSFGESGICLANGLDGLGVGEESSDEDLSMKICGDEGEGMRGNLWMNESLVWGRNDRGLVNSTCEVEDRQRGDFIMASQKMLNPGLVNSPDLGVPSKRSIGVKNIEDESLNIREFYEKFEASRSSLNLSKFPNKPSLKETPWSQPLDSKNQTSDSHQTSKLQCALL